MSVYYLPATLALVDSLIAAADTAKRAGRHLCAANAYNSARHELMLAGIARGDECDVLKAKAAEALALFLAEAREMQ